MRMTVIVFLILSSLVVKAQKQLSKDEYDAVTEKYRVEYQDADKLKKRLLGLFVSIEGTDQAGIEQLKQRFGISEALMRSVAMEIYTESLAAVKEKRTDGIDGGLDAYRQQVGGALFCLGLSADQSTKQLLMSIALDDKEEMSFRQHAIASYLRSSDAEETKNALLQLLVEKNKLDYMERLSIYDYARMAFEHADEFKRSAILNALYAAASGSDLTPWEFRVCDEILVKLSPVYARSTQRFELLKKFNAVSYPEKREVTKSLLKERLESMQKLKVFTNASTNLMILKSRDFNLPQPDLSSNDVTTAANGETVAKSKTGDTTKRSIGVYAFLGIPALLLLGFGAWKLTRR